MQHRKESHAEFVESCNKFTKNECPFQEEFCWFSHKSKSNNSVRDNISKNEEKEEDNSVFQKVRKPLKPPIN